MSQIEVAAVYSRLINILVALHYVVHHYILQHKKLS